jgi:recombination protein RecT
MSAANLKAVATGQVAKTERPKTIAGLLTDPSIKQQMALALPKHMTADRLARIALTEVRKNPTLGKCDQGSFLGAIMQCAQLGLEPGGALGHAYLLPFENKRKQITEVQFIVGYRGMIDLARRSGQIVSLSARAVHAGDRFRYSYGLNETVDHVPAENGGGELTHVYAVAKLRDGGVQFEVMNRAEVEKVRNESNGYKSAIRYDRKDNPWIGFFEEMAKKTVIRRLFKYLPVSIEMQTAVGLDEQAESGLAQDNPLTVDMDTGEVFGDMQHDPRDTPANVIAPEDAPDVGTDKSAPVMTFAAVMDKLTKAKTLDALDEAASLIASVGNVEHQAELHAKYDALRAALQ